MRLPAKDFLSPSDPLSDAKIDPLLESQFAAGRLYAAISSRPGQSGRADGYILEGQELEVRFHRCLFRVFNIDLLLSSTSASSVLASRSTLTTRRRTVALYFLL